MIFSAFKKLRNSCIFYYRELRGHFYVFDLSGNLCKVNLAKFTREHSLPILQAKRTLSEVPVIFNGQVLLVSASKKPKKLEKNNQHGS